MTSKKIAVSLWRHICPPKTLVPQFKISPNGQLVLNSLALFFRVLTTTLSSRPLISVGSHLRCRLGMCVYSYAILPNYRDETLDTFSHRVFTWFSDNCLHSFSCSIHWSSSFAAALSSIILIVIFYLCIVGLWGLLRCLNAADFASVFKHRPAIWLLFLSVTRWRHVQGNVTELVENLQQNIFLFKSLTQHTKCNLVFIYVATDKN